MLLEGLHIPLTTPFHPDGRLNTHKLVSNVARYSKTPASGLIVLGPSAEPTLLTDEETREVLRTAAEAATPEKVLIAGISRDSVHATLALALFAAELHYDAVMVAAPRFLVPEVGNARLDSSQRPIPLSERWLHELETFFEIIADRSPLPVVLLNAPGRNLYLSKLRRAASHPNIVGVFNMGHSLEVQTAVITSLLQHTAGKKREVTVTPIFAAVTSRMQLAAEPSNGSAALISASSLINAATAVAEPPPLATPPRTRAKSVGFQILSGNSGSLLDALNAGATGIAPAFAAAAPQACHEVYAAWKDSHLNRDESKALAEEKQARLIEAARLAEASPAALKYACDLNGYFGGLPRLPHLPPSGEQRTALELQMKPLRN